MFKDLVIFTSLASVRFLLTSFFYWVTMGQSNTRGRDYWQYRRMHGEFSQVVSIPSRIFPQRQGAKMVDWQKLCMSLGRL